ncbi:MAG TPA: rhomboid family intramembrane serine protease [Allosphingosinicella sp.]|nr:rhomboid family intramembrane serine protease [Allosphingosinicella sp.]
MIGERRSWGNGRSTGARQGWRSARFTSGIAILIAGAWFFLWASGMTGEAAVWGGFMSERLSLLLVQSGLALGDAWIVLLEPLTLTLIHPSFLQLAFNLLILIVCGRIVENIVGGGGLLLLFVVGAYAAVGAHFAADPHGTALLVGSSGAIGAVLGAYAMLAGRIRAKLRSQAASRAVNVLWLAATWIVIQLLFALTMSPLVAGRLASTAAALGVAANLGGFVAGLLLAKPLLLWKWRGA